MLKRTLPAIFFIALCLLISGISGWVTQHGMQDWYVQLQKPSFNPPAWVFAPVWTTLYILIGIAGGQLWRQRQTNRVGYHAYLLQLAFNFAWSFIFFGAHQIGWALLDLICLLIALSVTLYQALKHCRSAFWLLLPYQLWSLFAAVLNWSLWQLN